MEKIVDEIIDDSDDIDLKIDYRNFNEAVIWGTDWTTETIALQLKKGNIDLNPTFQRRDAWSDQEKSRLIESLMLGLPVPPIILAENKKKKNSYIVIDGKQRLLTIRRFYAEKIDKDELSSFKPLKIKGLDVLPHINNMTKEDIEEKHEDLIRDLENQSIRTIIIKNWPDEAFLYTVFLRLNTGSKRLSPQELRQALIPGAFLDYLDDATAKSPQMMKMLNNKGADTRMKDVELALRYIAFKTNISAFNGNLKEFLDNTCEIIRDEWEERAESVKMLFTQLENAIDFVFEIFDENNPFSRYSNGNNHNRFNRPIFEIFTYYFSDETIRKNVLNCKDEFVKEFIQLNDNAVFISCVSDTTKDTRKIAGRFEMFGELLSNLSTIKDNNIKIDILCADSGKLVVK